MADFILSDRRRIVEQLVRFKKANHIYKETWFDDAKKSIDETLKLAGVGE